MTILAKKSEQLNIQAKLDTFAKMEKVKKEEDKLEDMALAFNTETKKYCIAQYSSSCKKDKGLRPNGRFNKTSKTNIFSEGVVPICKDCIKSLVENKDGTINKENFVDILKILDLPYIDKDFEGIPRNSKDVFSDYIKGKVRSSIYNYDCSSHIGTRINSPTVNTGGEEGVIDADMDNLRFEWGDWYDDRELLFLQQTFLNYKNQSRAEEVDDLTLQEICHKTLEIRNLRKDRQPTDKPQETLLKMLDSAKLTAKSNKDVKDDSITPLGVRIQEMEVRTPCEVFEDRSIFKDHDGILDYFKRFILRPLVNFISGSKEFDKEFNVEEAEAFINSED